MSIRHRRCGAGRRGASFLRADAVPLTLACAFLLACEGAPPPGTPGSTGAAALAPVADPQQLMLHLVEPAAEVYWDAVGIVVDVEGEHPFAPATDAEWEAVTNAAWLLAESGNLLMLDERARESGHWQAMARGMREVGALAVEAAVARDPDAVFETGGDIYLVCTGCHAVYAAETLRPSYEAGPGAAFDSSPGDTRDPTPGATPDPSPGTAPDSVPDPSPGTIPDPVPDPSPGAVPDPP